MSDNSDSMAQASGPKKEEPPKGKRLTPILQMGSLRDPAFLDFRPRPIDDGPLYDADFDGYEEPPTRGYDDVQLPDPPADVKAELEEEVASDDEGDSSDVEVAPKDESVPEPAESQDSTPKSAPPESETSAPEPASSETTDSVAPAKATKKAALKPSVSGSRTSSSSRKSG